MRLLAHEETPESHDIRRGGEFLQTMRGGLDECQARRNPLGDDARKQKETKGDQRARKPSRNASVGPSCRRTEMPAGNK